MKKLCLTMAMGLFGIGSTMSGTLLAQVDLSVMLDKETLSSETRQGMMLAQATPQEMPMPTPMPMTDNDAESGESVKGRGTVVGMDKENRKVTLAHEAIAEWQWPPMTMTFDVADEVDMSQLQEGAEVEFMAVRPETGGQVVVAIGPAKGSPGMDVGGQFTPYDILLLKKDGSSEVYATVQSLADQS